MPIIVTLTLVLHAAFVSTRTASADAFIAVHGGDIGGWSERRIDAAWADMRCAFGAPHKSEEENQDERSHRR